MSEISKSQTTNWTAQILSITQAWLPIFTLVGGALWGLYTYVDHERKTAALLAVQTDKDAKVRMFEAAKPFFARQFSAYGDAARLLGMLCIFDVKTPEWRDAEQKYLLLAKGELLLFGLVDIEPQLNDVHNALAAFHNDTGQDVRRRFEEASKSLIREMGKTLFDIYESQGEQKAR